MTGFLLVIVVTLNGVSSAKVAGVMIDRETCMVAGNGMVKELTPYLSAGQQVEFACRAQGVGV